MGNPSIAPRMFHFPAHGFDSEFFSGKRNPFLGQFMGNDIKVFFLGQLAIMKDESKTV